MISIFSEYYMYFLNGVKNTILLSLLTVALGVVIGIFLALMRISKNKILKFISTAYVEFIRGTPLMVQLFIIYFGAEGLGVSYPDFAVFKQLTGVSSSDFIPAIIALAVNSSAYVSEIIRAGIQSIDKGQMEAARSLGMNYNMAMRYIIIPQAFKNILPALGNEFVVVIKESSIVSVIGIAELMKNANIVRSTTYDPFTPLIIAAIMYFILTFTLSKLLGVAERRMRTSD